MRPAAPSGFLRVGIAAALLAVLGLLYFFLFPQLASAHANVARAEPPANSVLATAPTTVTIWFTEPVEPSFSSIRVLDSVGAQMDNGDSAVVADDPAALSVTLKPLADGTYTVVWRNVSTVDGHQVRGSYTFSVGQPLDASAAPAEPEPRLLQSPAEPFFRWLVLLTALAAVGGLSFHLFVVGPVFANKGASEKHRRLGTRLRSRVVMLTLAALGLFFAASLGRLVVHAQKISDTALFQTLGNPLASTLTDTSWGTLWLWRAGLAVAMLALLAVHLRFRTRTRAQALLVPLALAVGAGALLTMSLSSHGAATAGIEAPAIFSDYLHLLAAAFWVGGLFHLAASVPVLFREVSAGERRTILSGIVTRFSFLAALSVGTLIVTGLYSAFAQVTVLSAATAPYGLTLIAKVALVAPILALAAANLLWVRPRLAKQDGASRWLRRLVAGEVALAVLVLLAVGFMTSMEPARQVASREEATQPQVLSFQDVAEGAAIRLTIEPGYVGANTYAVMLTDQRGIPIVNAESVQIRLTHLGSDLAQEEFQDVVHHGGGHYTLTSNFMSIKGAWQAEVLVRRPDAFDGRAAFRFEVGAPPQSAGGSARIAPSPTTGKLLLGVEVALLGGLLIGVAFPLGGMRARRGLASASVGLVVLFVGFFFILNAQGSEPAAPVTNPIAPDAASVATGRQLYTQNCQTCHGATGAGDGPAAATLTPKPLNLIIHVPLHPDEAIFGFISNGLAGTSMVAWRDKLSEEEIWHLVNYLKTLPEQAKQER
ncbi:MAG: c-type cytochrome [SAR202 cluster bacterium]|nr:c-type cytochrome [SAR202 cluster bacterium]